MSFWSEMWRLDAKIRWFLGAYLVTPCCVLSIPAGVFVLWQSTAEYRGLEQHHETTNAIVHSISQTGGRNNRNAVTAIFVANDGKPYVSKALYSIEGSKHVRPGMSLQVIYERGRPSHNAPSLAYARRQVRDVQTFLGIMAVVGAILAFAFRNEYASIVRRLFVKSARS
jgi:hypothetical protein